MTTANAEAILEDVLTQAASLKMLCSGVQRAVERGQPLLARRELLEMATIMATLTLELEALSVRHEEYAFALSRRGEDFRERFDEGH